MSRSDTSRIRFRSLNWRSCPGPYKIRTTVSIESPLSPESGHSQASTTISEDVASLLSTHPRIPQTFRAVSIASDLVTFFKSCLRKVIVSACQKPYQRTSSAASLALRAPWRTRVNGIVCGVSGGAPCRLRGKLPRFRDHSARVDIAPTHWTCHTTGEQSFATVPEACSSCEDREEPVAATNSCAACRGPDGARGR